MREKRQKFIEAHSRDLKAVETDLWFKQFDQAINFVKEEIKKQEEIKQKKAKLAELKRILQAREPQIALEQPKIENASPN